MVGTDAFQEADILGITRPCTKWNTQVRHVDDIAKAVNEAFHIATTGRPGPVLIDLPKDVTAGSVESLEHLTPVLSDWIYFAFFAAYSIQLYAAIV